MAGRSERFHRLVQEGPQGPLGRALSGALLPLSWLYGLIGTTRAGLYRRGILKSYRAPVPVVSVGNLTAGGTGKTPTVDHLLRWFLGRGIRVAVVSRGYRGTIRKGVGVVCRGEGPLLPAAVCGDEPFLLARRNPRAVVLVARRRAEGVRLAAEELGAEVVLLDDGFQHLPVRRDLDLVLLDARRPLGNGRLLPAGPLREFAGALRRGDLFLLTRSVGDETPMSLPGPVLHCRHRLAEVAVAPDGAEVPLASLAGRKAAAFAGIARPEAFFTDLRQSGLSVAATCAFPDHVAYGREEMARLAALGAGADLLVTTEKDGAKLAGEALPLPCYQIPMTLEFFEAGVLERHLAALLAQGDDHGFVQTTA